MALWKQWLIVMLKQILARLEDRPPEASSPTNSEKYSPKTKVEANTAPPTEATFIAATTAREKPSRSHVDAKPILGNIRPLYGREKFREQKHLAHCCATHGCCYGDNDCPVKFHGEKPYMKECC